MFNDENIEEKSNSINQNHLYEKDKILGIPIIVFNFI